ncbi:MAG: MFS transporter [Geminicoccaceae bacterium]|nr:MAG: MFS transporter [Geminicoccaceae bacterium]
MGALPPPLGWGGIVRLGLVQMALGAVIILTTATLNRVMVVEWMLPATLPGLLAGLHHAVQLLRPRWGYGSDMGGRRTPWIIGGMTVLAGGGWLAAIGTAVMGTATAPGIALAVLGYFLVGVGAGAAGTNLLVLIAARTAPERRPAAATICWVLMISGFVVTASVAGALLDPFSPSRLVAVSGGVSIFAVLLTSVAVLGIEGARPAVAPTAAATPKPGFLQALREVWSEPRARLFTLFVFVAMLGYAGQHLILEPFAGLVFGFTPGQSTRLASLQYGGVLVGMIGVGVLATLAGEGRRRMLRAWAVAGCLASAAALAGLAVGAGVGPGWPIRLNVFFLGFANGVFAVAAIGSMMGLVDVGRRSREGVRMGLWGAAQAMAMGFGGLLGAAAVDLGRLFMGAPAPAFAVVFMGEALLFVAAAALAVRVGRSLEAQGPNSNASPAFAGASARGG